MQTQDVGKYVLVSSMAFFFLVKAFNPPSYKARHTVSRLISIFSESFRSFASCTAVSALPDVIFQIILHLLAIVNLAGHPAFCFCVFGRSLARSLATVLWLTPSWTVIWHDERFLSTKEMMLFLVSFGIFFMVVARGVFRRFY